MHGFLIVCVAADYDVIQTIIKLNSSIYMIYYNHQMTAEWSVIEQDGINDLLAEERQNSLYLSLLLHPRLNGFMEFG